MIERYRGMTHLLPSYNWILYLWRKYLCKREIHIFDECLSSAGGDEDDPIMNSWRHYLVCDACQLMVDIKKVDTKYSKKYGIIDNPNRFGE